MLTFESYCTVGSRNLNSPDLFDKPQEPSPQLLLFTLYFETGAPSVTQVGSSEELPRCWASRPAPSEPSLCLLWEWIEEPRS